MTYFADFSRCTYRGGPFDADSWRCPLLSVGWLEQPNEFPMGGIVDPEARDRLAFFRFAFAEAYPEFIFPGQHDCSLCIAEGMDAQRAVLRDSGVNILVPGSGCVFLAPGRIDHYVEKHGYLLPPKFVRALMQCPDPRDVAYEAALSLVNGDASPLSKQG